MLDVALTGERPEFHDVHAVPGDDVVACMHGHQMIGYFAVRPQSSLLTCIARWSWSQFPKTCQNCSQISSNVHLIHVSRFDCNRTSHSDDDAKDRALPQLHLGRSSKWLRRTGHWVSSRQIWASNRRLCFFIIAWTMFVNSAVHEPFNRFCNRDNELHLGQYGLDNHVCFSFALDGAAHLGLRIYISTARSYHFAQGFFHDAEQGCFEAIIWIDL